LLTDNTNPIIVNISEETNKSLLDIINSLFPVMENLINMIKLYAYLIAFQLLTKVESEKLGPQSTKTKTEKIQYFLSLLDSKGPQGQKMFVIGLYRTKEICSHAQLIELLRSKGVTISPKSSL